MSKTLKLSKKELKTLNDYQSSQSEIIWGLGNISLQCALLEGKRSEILDKLSNLQEEQNKMAKKLQTKYGEGNIDLKTGEFTLTE